MDDRRIEVAREIEPDEAVDLDARPRDVLGEDLGPGPSSALMPARVRQPSLVERGVGVGLRVAGLADQKRRGHARLGVRVITRYRWW